MPSSCKSPRTSLADRLQRSRKHRSWLKNNAESSSLGGGASVGSTGDVSTASEPPHDGYIPATESADVSIKATSSLTSPEHKADSLHARRQRAMALGRRTRTSGGAASPYRIPNSDAPSPEASASIAQILAIAPIPRKNSSIKQKKEAVQPNYLGTQNSEDPVPLQAPPRPRHMTSPPPPEQRQQPSHPMNMAPPPPQQHQRQLQGQPSIGQQQRQQQGPPNMTSPPPQYQQRQQQGPPNMASPPPQYQQQQQQEPPNMASPPPQYQQQQHRPPNMASPPPQYQRRQQHGPPNMASPAPQDQQRQQHGPPNMASPPPQYQQRQQPVARSYQQGRPGQQPNVVSPAPSQAELTSDKRCSTGTMPYQPRETPVSQPRTSNLPSVPQASEEMKEGSPADVNKRYGGAVIETPKVSRVSSLRASFDKRAKEASMPMNSPDLRNRHSFPVKANDVRSFDERSDASGASSNGQPPTLPNKPPNTADRPSWQNRAPSPTLPEPSNPPRPSGDSRPSWQNRGALQNPVSKGRESPTPPAPQINGRASPAPSAPTQGSRPSWKNRSVQQAPPVLPPAQQPQQRVLEGRQSPAPQTNGRASPAPRASLPVATQGPRPSWQNRPVQEAPPVPPPAHQPQQQASRHSWRQHAPGQQLPPADSFQQRPPPKQLSQASKARQALQNQLNPEAQPPSWNRPPPPPQATSSWQPQSQTQDAPLTAQIASWQERYQQQKQGQPSWPQNLNSSPEEEPDEEEDEQQQPRQIQTRPSPVIAPPKNFAPNSQPRQQRDYQPRARPKRKKSFEKDSPLVSAILPDWKLAEKEMPLPLIALPQKERPLPLVILPSKEAPKKELPPFILPSKEPPKKELPPFILPSNEPPKKELLPGILPQKESDTIMNNSASNPGADSQETSYEDQLQANYSESAGSWQDHSVSTGTSVSSPQKSPSKRPPLPSPQNQKSPWQKWAAMQGHDDLEIVKEVQSPERDENVGSRTVEGIYGEEKKSSSDDATASVDDGELAVQEAESEDKFTYLARMAADSTLIADYEEAMKQASKPILDDDDDSYTSGALMAQSSALPQDVPLEFQQALAGSPSKYVESFGEAEPVVELPRTKPSLTEELLREVSVDYQENEEEEAPVFQREIETYAAEEYLREESGDLQENDEEEASVLQGEIETYAANEYLREESGDLQENDEEEAPVLRGEIETYAAREYLREGSRDLQGNDEEEAPVLRGENETYAATEYLSEASGGFQGNDEEEAPVLEREVKNYAAKEDEPETEPFDDSEHKTQMKTYAALEHELRMEALATPGHDPMGHLEEIEEDDGDEEEPSPTPTLPSTPKSGKRYPKLAPSARDNEMYPDVYRSIYFSDDSMSPTSRGPERRRSSPRKESSPASSRLSPEVENARTHLEQMQLAERAAPIPYQDSYDSVELYMDDKKPMQPVLQNSPRKEVSPRKQAKYMGVGLLASSQSADEESSTEITSNLQTSYPMQTSYPEELMLSMKSRSNDQYESSYYPDPDPEFSDVQSEVESDAVFGIPETYGAAGGDEEQEAISPSIKQRGHAIEEWQLSLSPTKSVGQSSDRFYEQPRGVSTSPDKKKVASAAQIVGFWANDSSREEEEEAEQFAETEEWKDRDPDFFPEMEDDDDDVYRESYISEPRLKVITAPQGDNQHKIDELDGWLQGGSQAAARGVSRVQAPVDPDTPNSRAWVANSSFVSSSGSQGPNELSTPKRSKQKKKKQEVFDPFGGEEELRISNSGDLFSPLLDPFAMTEESFSPPSWDTPRGRMSFGSPGTELLSNDWGESRHEI